MKNLKQSQLRSVLQRQNHSLSIPGIDRPSDAYIECFDWYENCIIDMDLENKESILMGDFNCDWSKLVINGAASHTVRMATLASTYQFEQMIKEPTWVAAIFRTLIDLAFCNKP